MACWAYSRFTENMTDSNSTLLPTLKNLSPSLSRTYHLHRQNIQTLLPGFLKPLNPRERKYNLYVLNRFYFIFKQWFLFLDFTRKRNMHFIPTLKIHWNEATSQFSKLQRICLVSTNFLHKTTCPIQVCHVNLLRTASNRFTCCLKSGDKHCANTVIVFQQLSRQCPVTEA